MQKIVTEYRTVEARIPFAMETMMQELLGDGYQPYCNPYIYSEADGSNICCQAMVRYHVVESKSGSLDARDILRGS